MEHNNPAYTISAALCYATQLANILSHILDINLPKKLCNRQVTEGSDVFFVVVLLCSVCVLICSNESKIKNRSVIQTEMTIDTEINSISLMWYKVVLSYNRM